MGALSHRAELVFEMVQTRIALLQGILRELCKSWGGNAQKRYCPGACRYQEVFTPDAHDNIPCVAMSGSIFGDGRLVSLLSVLLQR